MEKYKLSRLLRIVFFLFLTGLVQGTPQGKRQIESSDRDSASTFSTSSTTSSPLTSSSRILTAPYPTGNITASTSSGTSVGPTSSSSVVGPTTISISSSTSISTSSPQPSSASASATISSTTSFPTLSAPFSSLLSYGESSGALRSSDFPRGAGTGGISSSSGVDLGSDSTKGIFPSSGTAVGSGTFKSIISPSGKSVGTGSVTGISPSNGTSAGSGTVRGTSPPSGKVAGSGTAAGMFPSSGVPEGSGTVKGIFPSSGVPAGNGTVRGIFPSSGMTAGSGTGFPQMTGFSRGNGVSASAPGTDSGTLGGYGPSGSGISGSLGGWARNPACTASWNSRFSAANGTVISTTTYSYTVTIAAGITTTLQPGRVATGPTTATLKAGTATYEVGSDSQCCGDCNVLYPNVKVYYWPANNDTSCLKGQTAVPPGLATTRVANASDSGPSRTPTAADLSSLTSTGLVGIPSGGFDAEKRAERPRDASHPTITPGPKLPRAFARPAPQVQPRRFLSFGGPAEVKALPSGNATNQSKLEVPYGTPSNFSLGHLRPFLVDGLFKEVVDVVDGMTFISPTVYVVISTVSAKNKCGNVGETRTSLTFPFHEDQISTVDASGVTSAVDFAGSPCSASSGAIPNPAQGNTAALRISANSYHPGILVPQTALQRLDPSWQSCNVQDLGQGFDVSSQLTPHTIMVEEPHFPAKAPAFLPQALSLLPGDGDDQANAPKPQGGPVFKTPNSNLAQVTPGMDPRFQIVGPNQVTIAAVPPNNVPGPVQLAPPTQSALVPDSPAQSTPPNPPQQPNLPAQPNPSQQPNSPGQPNNEVQPNLPAKEVNAPGPQQQQQQQQQQQPAAATPSAVVVDSSGTPLTLTQGGPAVKIGEQSVGLVGPNIVAGSQTTLAPVQQPGPTDSTAPIVAGGITLTPASTNPPAVPPPSPVQFAGLAFSVPEVQPQAPPNPQPAPSPNVPPVVAGGITYQPVAQGPSPTPVAVGGLTFNPVLPSNLNSPQQPQAPAIGAPGQTGAANIVVGGQKFAAGVTVGPADAPIIQDGVTINPVPAGAPASTPLGVVGGLVISGGSSQAVVAGQTFSAGGPPVTVQGTPVSLANSNIVIGSSTAALPEALPTDAPAPLGVVGGQVINGNSQSAIVQGQTVSAGGPPVIIQGTPVSLGGSNIVIGTSTAALPAARAPGGDSTNAPLGIVGGQVITGDKSHAVVDGQTILPGSVATVSGTPVSLGASNIVIGTDSVPLPTDVPGGIQSAGPSAFAIGGSTVSNGGSPITVSGTRISLGPSGLVVGSSTVPLTNAAQLSQATGLPVYSIDGTGVTQGSPAITVSGTRISLGSSNVVIGSSTIALPSSSVFSVGGQVFTPQAGGFSIDGTTITPGGPGVTVSGTAVSIDSNSNLIFGSSTVALPAGATGSPTLAVAGETLTARPKSLGGGFVVGGQTITPGAAPVTVSGTAVSLNTASSLIIGSSTIALASAGPGDFYKGSNSPLTANGETFTPLGPSSVAIDGTTLSVSGAAITDHGTVVSLASGGLVVGSSTFAYATPASNTLTSITNGPISGQGASPSIFTIDGETFTAEPSGLLIDNTEVSIGGSAVTINGTVISLASNSLIVGASTIPLASVTGLTAAIASPTPAAGSAPPLLGATNTGKGAKTGAAGRLEATDFGKWTARIWLGFLSGTIAWVLLM